jgi:ABC-type sugar transport system ATPase subunit
MNAITLTQVSKSYGAVQEINALDLTIGAGQAVEIHGGTALLRTLDADVTLQGRCIQKVGARNRIEAVRSAQAQGWL